MWNNQHTLRKEDMSINRVDGELTWLVQSKSDKSINCLPCSEAYRGVDGELTWLVQSKRNKSVNHISTLLNTSINVAPTPVQSIVEVRTAHTKGLGKLIASRCTPKIQSLKMNGRHQYYSEHIQTCHALQKCVANNNQAVVNAN